MDTAEDIIKQADELLFRLVTEYKRNKELRAEKAFLERRIAEENARLGL